MVTITNPEGVGLTAVGPGAAGLLMVTGLQFALIACCSIFGPLGSTYRLRATRCTDVSRMLTAWSISSNVIRAILVLAWGALATCASPRWALAGAGLALLLIPVLLPLGFLEPRGTEHPRRKAKP